MRASQGGAAAFVRQRFKVPLNRPTRPIAFIAFVTGDTTTMAEFAATGQFASRCLPPISALGEKPTAALVAQMIDAEFNQIGFRQGEIAVEWPPAPGTQARYLGGMKLMRKAIGLVATQRRLPLVEITLREIAAAFGSSDATRPSVQAAVRDAGIGYEDSPLTDKEVSAVALGFVARLQVRPKPAARVKQVTAKKVASAAKPVGRQLAAILKRKGL